MVLTASARAASSVPPLTPDAEEARRWAERELADPAYAAAEPTALDRIARAIGDFFASLWDTDLGGGGPWVSLVAAIVVTVVIVAAFLIWGVPRATGRARGTAQPFGADDERTAADLRREAAARAAAADWNAAVVLRFRALARGLVERGAVDAPPGATVHAFARQAAAAFPAHADALEEAARAFDDVRYLRRPGTAGLYARVAEVDDALARTRPVPVGLPSPVEAPR